MAEEGEAQASVHLPELSAQGVRYLEEILNGLVGELARLAVTPDELDRIELGRVGRQPFHLQPIPVALEVLPGDGRLVSRESIPDQDELSPAEQTLERAQKADDVGGLEAAEVGAKHESAAAAISVVGHSSRH